MDRVEAEVCLRITVAHSPADGQAVEQPLCLRDGSTLADALAASGVLAAWPPDVATGLRTGIWGVLRPRHTPLADGDRVELYRPLAVDPKEARRTRARQQRRKVQRAGPAEPGQPSQPTPPS